MAAGSADMMRQAQNVWAMLDRMSEDDPAAYRKFIDKNLNEGKEYMKWKNTPPDPHMCVQTKLLGDKEKTFYMNFCSYIRVPEPKSYDAPIPVISSDILCMNANVSTVIVAFAPKVLETFGRDCTNVDEQTSLIQLAIDFLQDVHKVKISRTFKILTNKLTHGNMNEMIKSLRTKVGDKEDDGSLRDMFKSMQNNFAPLSKLSEETIDSLVSEEVSPDIVLPGTRQTSDKVLIEEIGGEDKEIEEPGYTLKSLAADAELPRRLVLNVTLNDVASVRECQLDVGQEEVSLLVEDKYKLHITLPEPVDDRIAKAKFSKKSSTLTVTLPTVN